jgi:hypothetical protein
MRNIVRSWWSFPAIPEFTQAGCNPNDESRCKIIRDFTAGLVKEKNLVKTNRQTNPTSPFSELVLRRLFSKTKTLYSE